jgi:hypothetical protein
MKGNNFSKKFNGQIQTMGKGGIKDISNTNAIQPTQNYSPPNMNYGNQFNPMYPMNQNQMYPNQMPMMQQQNPYNPMMMYNNNNYQGFNNNGMGMRQNVNNYENSKNKNTNNDNNNPMVRNAKMILDNNNIGNKNNMRQKSKSAKKVTDISKSNDIGYQGGQGAYNNALPMNNFNMGMNNMNNNLYGNNNGFQMMNNPPNMYNQMNNQYNNMNMKNNNSAKTPNMKKRIIKKENDFQYMEFHPYTLKDYKELTRNPVVMGPLGANIGTKEWEFKRNKMKKMQNYSNNINKEHKGITSLKKDTPKDEIEKLTKQKIENSIRHRAYEYSKLVRAGKYKDENENIGKNDNLGVIQENDDDLYLKKYEDQLRQETENMNNPKPKEPIVPVVEENNDKEDLLDIDQLLKQKEDYKAKIQGIRDTLLD